MNERTIGDQITEDILNENFPTREMKIQHLKNISNAIKSNPELKETLKKELSFYSNNEHAKDCYLHLDFLIINKQELPNHTRYYMEKVL